MKLKWHRLLALLLALALVFSLAACGDDKKADKDDEEDGKKDETPVSGEANGEGASDPNKGSSSATGGEQLEGSTNAAAGPNKTDDKTDDKVDNKTDDQTDLHKLLRDANALTSQDMADRFDVEPFRSINQILGGKSSTVDMKATLRDLDTGAVSAVLGGALYQDSAAEKLLLDASLQVQGMSIGGKLYAEPDFVGVSCPFLLGSETFYGVKPRDFYDQAMNSILAPNSGSGFAMDPDDLDVFQQIDDMLDSLQDVFQNASGSLGVDEMMEKIKNASDKFTDQLSITSSKEKVSYKGSQVDGTVLSYTLNAAQMADLYDDMVKAITESGWFTSLLDLADQSGDFDRDEIDAELKNASDNLRNSGGSLDVTTYIADGRVVRTEIVSSTNGTPDTTDPIMVDYYGTDGKTFSFTAKSTESKVSCLLTMDDTSNLRMALDFTVEEAYQGSEQMKGALTWNSTTGDLSADLTVTPPSGETQSVSLTGNLTVSGSSFSFVSQEFPVDANGEQIGLTLSFSGQSSGVVPSVTDRTNLFDLSEDELMDLLAKFGVGGSDDSDYVG